MSNAAAAPRAELSAPQPEPGLPAASQKQPKGLYVLFSAEAWERMSYYGMRALLVLYLTSHLKMERANALQIYGVYTGLVYFTPLLGGYLADKVLGARKAVLIGGVVMALGHLAMAFEPLLHIALGLLIVGNGFFKPNISTIVGGLYTKNDPRRDGGFTIFYMGINLGAFFSPLICGTLGEKVGWHWGFGAAGVGMVFGLLSFIIFQKHLGKTGFPPGRVVTDETRLEPRDWMHVAAYIAACVVGVIGAVQLLRVAGGWVLGSVILGGLLAAEIVRRMITPKPTGEQATPLTGEDWHAIGVIAILCFFNIFFWMGFEQAGGTMNLFADEQTDRHLFSLEIPATWFQSINPLLIVCLAPIFSLIWLKLDQTRFRLSTAAKMGIGMILLGFGFVVMYLGQNLANEVGRVGPLWLASVYTLHTIGELVLSPIGLSMVTKLAATRIVSLMMGIWFLSSAVANYLAGTLEELLKHTGFPLYGFLIASSIGAGLIVLLISPKLTKWSHGRG